METTQVKRQARTQKPSEDVRLSKTLSYLLRHGAGKAKLDMRPDGFVRVAQLLESGSLGRATTVDKVLDIVKNCEKQRFSTAEIDGQLFIRANQGHTVDSIDRELTYTRITSADDYPVCVHGTSKTAWGKIRSDGLCRMARNEIHFAKGLPGDASSGRSGFRASSQVLIFINLALCLEHGIPWFESSNGVLLTPGLGSRGVLPPGYFQRAIERDGEVELEFERKFDFPE